MSWMDQFTLVIRSSITSLREKVEDPERMLHQLLIDMDEELLRLRKSTAEAIADEILLRQRCENSRTESERWLDRARTALKKGDETIAKSALERKVQAEQRAQDLEAEHKKQREQTQRLEESVKDLEDKIRQARQKRTLLLARLARAESSRQINDALDRASHASAFAAFHRMETRVERAEAVAEAYDRLEGRDPEADALDRQFEEEARREQIDEELASLKSRLSEGEPGGA